MRYVCVSAIRSRCATRRRCLKNKPIYKTLGQTIIITIIHIYEPTQSSCIVSISVLCDLSSIKIIITNAITIIIIILLLSYIYICTYCSSWGYYNMTCWVYILLYTIHTCIYVIEETAASNSYRTIIIRIRTNNGRSYIIYCLTVHYIRFRRLLTFTKYITPSPCTCTSCSTIVLLLNGQTYYIGVFTYKYTIQDHSLMSNVSIHRATVS